MRLQDEQPYRDPADLPQFVASDRNHIKIAMTDCFSAVDSVRPEHVEPQQGDQASMAEVAGAPDPVGRGEPTPQTPPDLLRNCSPLCPPSPAGIQGKGPEGWNPSPLRNPILPRGEEPIQGEALPPLYAPRPLIRLLQMDWPCKTKTNPRILTPCGPLFGHPPMPFSPRKSTQPPNGQVIYLCPPRYLDSALTPPTCPNNRLKPSNFPKFYPMTPSLKQDGTCQNIAETWTWKITAKTMVHENPFGRLSNGGTATDQIRIITQQPNTKSEGRHQIKPPSAPPNRRYQLFELVATLAPSQLPHPCRPRPPQPVQDELRRLSQPSM